MNHALMEDQALFGRDGDRYLADVSLIEAANVAIALEIPLLLTGAPGCGKTDFAFAVARAWANKSKDWKSDDDLEDGLLQCYVRSDSTARDLLYRYDAIRRFGDAHHGDDKEKSDARDARRYIDLMPLGIALSSERRRVLLIDEIDKAPRDLPNDLLRELDHGQFEIPEVPSDAAERYPKYKTPLRHVMGFEPANPKDPQRRRKPLIIVTSNEERQLPNAFLRRCAFCHIEFPTNDRLEAILDGRYPEDDHPALTKEARAHLVSTFQALHNVRGLIKPPSTSELIRWVGALLTVLGPSAFKRAMAFRAKQDPWTKLPGRTCLIKLREDEERLAR